MPVHLHSEIELKVANRQALEYWFQYEMQNINILTSYKLDPNE